MRLCLSLTLCLAAFAVQHSAAQPTPCSSLGAFWNDAYYAGHEVNSVGWSGGSQVFWSQINSTTYGGKDITFTVSVPQEHTRLAMSQEIYLGSTSNYWEGIQDNDRLTISADGSTLMTSSFSQTNTYNQCYPSSLSGCVSNSRGSGADETDAFSPMGGVSTVDRYYFDLEWVTTGDIDLRFLAETTATTEQIWIDRGLFCYYFDPCEGVACNDGNPDACVAQNGVCSGGTCVYPDLVNGEPCLDDGESCNGAETCSPSGDCESATTCPTTGTGTGTGTGSATDVTAGGSADDVDADADADSDASDAADDDDDDDEDDTGGNSSIVGLLGGLVSVAVVVGLTGFALMRRGSSSEDDSAEAGAKKKLVDSAAAAPARKASVTKTKTKPSGSAAGAGGAAAAGGAKRPRQQSLSRARNNSRGRSKSQGRNTGGGKVVARTSQASRASRADFMTSMDLLASRSSSVSVADDESARHRFTKLLTHKDLHVVVALIDATPVTWAEVTCRTIVAAFVANKQVVYLLRSLVTREIAYAENPSDAFKATSRAAKCFAAFAKVAGGAFLREALGKPLEASITGGLALADSDTKGLEKAASAFLSSIVGSTKAVPQEFQRVLNVLHDSAKEKWTENKARELLAGFVFVRLLCPSIAFPSGSGLADKDLVTPKIQSSLVLVSKVMQKLAMGVKFSAKDGELQKMNDWLDAKTSVMDKFMSGLAQGKAKNRQTMMELPKWGEEGEVSRFSIMSSASAITAMSYLGAAADGVVVPQDLDALVGQALSNEDKFMEVLQTGRDAAPEELVAKIKALLARFKQLNQQALADSNLA